MNNDEKDSGFVSHLTELRKRLIHSFIFLFIFFLFRTTCLGLAWLKRKYTLGTSASRAGKAKCPRHVSGPIRPQWVNNGWHNGLEKKKHVFGRTRLSKMLRNPIFFVILDSHVLRKVHFSVFRIHWLDGWEKHSIT